MFYRRIITIQSVTNNLDLDLFFPHICYPKSNTGYHKMNIKINTYVLLERLWCASSDCVTITSVSPVCGITDKHTKIDNTCNTMV